MEARVEITVYVRLLDEGTDVWRPVAAHHVEGDLFLLAADQPVPEDETWEFSPGSMVLCRPRQLSGGARLAAEASP